MKGTTHVPKKKTPKSPPRRPDPLGRQNVPPTPAAPVSGPPALVSEAPADTLQRQQRAAGPGPSVELYPPAEAFGATVRKPAAPKRRAKR